MATTATTEAPTEHNSFPPFQTENFPSQLVWLALTFILLYVVMAKVALPRVGSILEARAKRLSDDLAAANRFKEQSDAAHAAYEKSLSDARTRAQGIANSTREQHMREAEELHKRLEAEMHERLAAAERSIAQTRGAAMSNVGTIAADAASAIVERLIGQAPAKDDVAAAVGQAIKS
ncbi:MAG TPA: F0F1 ATP synthase subunit B' [Xanthobacteraceae bacterium]|nr:F0F1 ATP synthase subunit B' [Xanthobacteraceae bacterium]